MSQLPKGWMKTNFDSVIESLTNGISDKQNKESQGIPVTRIETIASENINYSRIGYVAGYDKEKAKKFLLSKGDILFSHINSPVHLGKTAVYDGNEELFHGTNLLRIVVDKKVTLPSYFNYFCKYTRATGSFSLNAQHAVNQSSLNQKKIKAFEIPLAPLAEQTRIVEKLDEVLAQVDTIKARLDGIPAILKRFRQSVLAAAVSGKLTEEWRGGSCFVAKEYTLKDVTHMDIGHAFKSKEFSETGIPLLRGQNIEPGALRWVDTKFFPEDKLTAHRKLFIEEGDIILAMDRPIVSAGLKLARAKKSDLPCVLVQRVARIRTNDLAIDDYIYLLLKDASFSDYLVPNQTGSDIPHISGKQIQAYQISIPALEEQKEIVRLVDQYFAFADTIEAQVKKAQARVDKLTQSILAKAFRGELVPQDPNDEPADKLLERIAAARKEAEALAKAAKKAGRKRAKA
ncbi:restriction endonuclease subunit S [Grimontia hollisae]|uniref:restriction endonuclease subunit S n=1 Tax=Grimontia hollisae TaxID=673 RepID=UPI0012ACE638|nr:restriction endonuclease subunit S [Grimontia hollisae]